jgi:cytochrome c553
MTSAQQRFADAQTVLEKNSCYGCHGTWHDYTEAQYQSLTTSYGNFVVKGNPAASGVILITTTTNTSQRMPLGGSAVSDSDLATLRNWIQNMQ